MDHLVNAEAVLKARGEALQQIHAETLAAIEEAQKDENSAEQQAQRARRVQLEDELNSAAKKAVKELAAVEKIVRAAIDGTHTALVKNVQGDKTLTPQDMSRKTHSNADFKYLYSLYAFFERSRKEREMIAGFERNAARIANSK